MTTTRREFGRMALGTAGALMVAPDVLASSEAIELGIQLYSVRDVCERELPGTLKALRAMGYRELEFFTFYDKSPADIRKLLADNGQRCRAAHYHYPVFSGDFGRELEYAQALGLEYMVSAWVPEEFRKTREDWLRIAESLNRAGERCHSAGIQLLYHNHNFEFRRFGEQTAFDLLLDRTNSELVKLEVDCYWMVAAGEDPVRFLDELGSRVRLLHVKDRKFGFKPAIDMNEGEAPFAVLGRGSIDYSRILGAARRAGVKLAYIDQDACEGAPLQCADESTKAWPRLR